MDEAFYAAIFHSMVHPVFLKNTNLEYVAANQAFCSLMGLRLAEIVGSDDHLFFTEEETVSFRENDQKVLQTGNPEGKEEFTKLVRGSMRRYLTTKSLLEAPDGTRYILGVSSEITDKSLIFDKLRESESLIRTLVHDSPNLVLVHANGKILYKNLAMTQLLCHPGGEFIAKDGIGLYRKTGKKTLRAALISLACQAIGQHEEIEMQLNPYEGGTRYFLLKNSYSSYQNIKAIMSVLVEITERKHLESYVLNKIIETEDRDRKRFAVDLHDDLGPILSSIKIHLGLDRNMTDPLQFLENMEICKKLIKEAFEKIRIISNNITPSVIDMYGLDPAIRSFIRTLRVEKTISVQFHSDLGDKRFSNELEMHFLRIVCELINNSIKHSGAAKVNVHLGYSGSCITLLYWDDGKGYNVEEIMKSATGMGISNLYYRVSVIGGELDFLHRRGKVIVRIRKNFK